ncbi:Transposase [Gemmata obscuriglobus]|uniref:Transposase n=1 Tax=Gemmata obscuriglobus TaxID=114 RepID=A0A2Z3HFJ4_9BACT|nr:transposase [Gemmata obscuriglobus]AWM42546.1 hypothetical protein C1280_36680 [Gemmata obscuriglobus]QEG32029.1 Transposase [Gemmata obscuriglobus]VTS11379.1 transposase : : HTH_Tnp_1 [Gemmata obscuriglobus UQM 2246]
MAGTRKVYTPEFKLQAVQMITEQKLSVAEVARRLGHREPAPRREEGGPQEGCRGVTAAHI